MAKTKYYNKTTQQWEYAETGCIPVRGTHYWVAQDLKPLHDYISSRVMATAEVCFLTVSVTSNQSDKSALEGLALSVTFPDGRTAEVEAGSVIAFTEGSVTVQFPEVTGYKRPDNLSVSYAKGSVTETATYLAEEVTVNALVDGAASSEFSYEVSGEGIVCLTGSGTSFTGVTKWLVPHGVTITVTPSSVDGYTTNAVTHTASGVTGSVSVEWAEVKLGVYIEDVNGKLWTADEWDGSATANGVAVLTENCRFVVALEDVDGMRYTWSYPYNSATAVGVTTANSVVQAQGDYNGKDNTEVVMSNYAVEECAFKLCDSYIFSNSQNGYLGAAGEWQALIDNFDAFETARSKCDGADLNITNWTSTQKDLETAWVAVIGDSLSARGLDPFSKGNTYSVRAFTTLKMDTV